MFINTRFDQMEQKNREKLLNMIEASKKGVEKTL